MILPTVGFVQTIYRTDFKIENIYFYDIIYLNIKYLNMSIESVNKLYEYKLVKIIAFNDALAI